jgi:hypothetical protein
MAQATDLPPILVDCDKDSKAEAVEAASSASAFASWQTATGSLGDGPSVDLDESHLPELVKQLSNHAGDVVERAIVSLWAQSVMDDTCHLDWSIGGDGFVRSVLPEEYMQEAQIQQVIKSIAEGSHRMAAVAKAGAIPPLVARLSSTEGREAQYALCALDTLAQLYENRVLLVEAGAIPLLERIKESDHESAWIVPKLVRMLKHAAKKASEQ